MKKSNKVLLITGLVAATIGTAGVLHTNYMQNPSKGSGEIKAYNHQPANILDNVFERNKVKYLPFIFENSDQTVTKDKIVSEFVKRGLTVTDISTGSLIATGTKIKVQQNSDVYTVIIYGDVDGDGEVNVFDAQECVDDYVNNGEYLKGVYRIAANVENDDGEIDVFDAQRIVDFYVGIEDKLVLNEPVSDKEADTTPPVITLKGQANIELEEGDSYTEEGVTATDNYDGELTIADIQRTIQFKAEGSSSTQTVTDVDTNQIGTYTITYTATDSNGNSSSRTRTIVVKQKTNPPVPDAKVESIELVLAANFKTEYQYGEATKLDLTGAQITVKTDDGKTTTKNVTNSMLSSYDLTTEGTKTITVTYEGVTATNKNIEVKVLNKISELVMSNTGMSNAQTTENGYQTNSKEDFVLGTIQAKQETDGSTLQQGQLKVETTVVPTTDNTVTASDLAISFETDADGNILVKGKAGKVGNYTIKAYIEYGSQKVEKVIQLNAKKSDVVGQVKVIPTEENEVIKVEKVAKRKLTVINVNGEEIEVTSGNVIISEKNGITITKLDVAGKPIGENATETVVDSLQIATTLETEQTITMDMTVNGKTADFTFSIKAKSVLSSIEIQEDALNVYAVLPSNEPSVIPGMTSETAGNIYTLIKPVFKDQYGDDMIVKADDIVASADSNIVDREVQDGKIGILLPRVEVKHTGIPVEVPDICIDYRSYQGETIVTGEDDMDQLGFSIILNDADKTVNLEKLAQAKIVVKYGNEEIELPIKVHYKKLTNLGINTSTITLKDQDDEGNYITKINEEFTLGVITVGAGETPVTADMLTTEIVGDSSGITISYTSENGSVVVKGVVTKEGVYQVKPKVGEVVGAGIDIRGISTPDITSIDMADFELQIGESQVEKELIVKSDINPTLQPIKARELTFSQRDADTDAAGEFLNITLKNASNQVITAEARPDEIVKSIELSVKDNILDEKTVKLKIILFAGEENEYSQDVVISIKKSIPKGIEIGDTITLHDTHIPGETVEGSDGVAYTLLPVELFADENNTRKLSVADNLFAITEDQKTNRVYLERPTVSSTIGGSVPAGQQQILLVKYFDQYKEEASKDIMYVGIGIKTPPGLTCNKAELNGAKINAIIDGNTVATITINYTENS